MQKKYLKQFNVAIVGSGYISDTHIEALRSIGCVNVCAVCDVVFSRAEALRKKWGIQWAYSNIDDLLSFCDVDVAHIVVPPPVHATVAEKLLAKGVSVFIEKPMALSTQDCRKLIRLAERNAAHIGVNHNFNHHPAFQRLLKDVFSMKIGHVQHVIVVNNMPLRQLTTKDYSHWMFHEPGNIIFEQCPHVFAHIYELLGSARRLNTHITGERELIKGSLPFYDTWQISIECEKGTAQIYYSTGKDFPENWLHVIGQDGSIHIDLINNLYSVNGKTKWPEFFSSFLNSSRNSRSMLVDSFHNLKKYIVSFTGLRGRSDTFFLGMKGRMEEFYGAIMHGLNSCSQAHEGLAVIDFCEKTTAILKTVPNGEMLPTSVPRPKERNDDVLVIGGTGFIGRQLVARLTEMGMRVRVLTRKPRWVPEQLRNHLVNVVEGDITDKESVFQAVRKVPAVYHLATGTGNTWDELRGSMVGGLNNVAQACLDTGVSKLFFASTIAVYDLGSGVMINEKMATDNHPEKRGPYARAKIASEDLLMNLFRAQGLPNTIFRPAVVIGKSGIPQHSAIGLWVNDIHCFGWGDGNTPLPFVLVDDVISALVKLLSVKEQIGKSFNFAGDIRLTAREYVKYLGSALKRRIYFILFE